MDDEPLIQEGFGKKRSYDEMRDDDSGISTEVRDDKTYFIVTDLKQVRVRRFATTGLDYTIKFTDTLANLELLEYHTRVHEIFQSLLETVRKDVPVHDQVRLLRPCQNAARHILIALYGRHRHAYLNYKNP